MQINVPSPAVGVSSGSSSAEKKILLEEKHLKLRNKMEKEAYKQLKTQRFIHTSVYDPALLQSTGEGGSTSQECLYKVDSQPTT